MQCLITMKLVHPHTSFEEANLNGLLLPTGAEIDDTQKHEWRHKRNTLANLQLLEGSENESKNKTPLIDWLQDTANMENVKFLPEGISYELSNFDEFIEKRQVLMSEALKKILL